MSPIQNWFAYGSLEGIANGKLTDAINYFVGFSALVAVVMIIVSGYMFMTAAGDSEKIEKATKTITAAVIGMVIVFIARILVVFIVERIAEGSAG